VSDNHDEWLGTGVYFFIDGISEGIHAAEEWAIAQAWNNMDAVYTYTDYSVLKALVAGKRVLDLTGAEGLKAYNLVRMVAASVYADKFSSRKGVGPSHDKLTMNLAFRQMKLDIILSHMYVRNADFRKRSVFSRIPNVTMLCVKDPANIDVERIEIVKQGVIHEH